MGHAGRHGERFTAASRPGHFQSRHCFQWAAVTRGLEFCETQPWGGKTEGLLWTKWVLPTAAEAKPRVTLNKERLMAMDFPEELA